MIERHYIQIGDIYKLPVMDFSLMYTKIINNINMRIEKSKQK